MVILSLASFPPESGKEAGKRFVELPPLPEYLTMRGPYIHSVQGGGIHVITIYEVDQAMMAKALVFIFDRHVSFFDVPGYTYDVKPGLEVQEGLKMVGLA